MISRKLATALLLSTVIGTAAQAQSVTTVGAGNTLVTVNAAAPGTVVSSRALTGIGAGQTLVGIDTRPANSRLIYGLSNTGQLYAINGVTGAATAVGAPTSVANGSVGVDFNPSVDRIRVVTSNGANVRLNPNTGAVAGTDIAPMYVATDVNAGAVPALNAVAYTNNVAGGTPTTLYAIDGNGNRLVRVGSLAGDTVVVSPNTGQLTTVGALGVANTGTNTGFDISSAGQALVAESNATTGTTSLYSVNLTTGAATLVGQLGTTGAAYNGLTFTAPTIGSYAANANQFAIGNAFDSFVGVPSEALNGVFTSLDALPAGARSAALAQFTPAGYAILPDLTLRTAEFQESTIRRYLRDFRAGGTGVQGAAGEAAPGDRKLGSFLVASGRTGQFDANSDRAETKFGSTGVMGGIDLRLSEKSLIGVTGGYDHTDFRIGSASQRSNIDSWFAGGYGTLGVGPFYVDLFGTYGKADYDIIRAVRFGTDNAGGFGTNLNYFSDGRSRTYLGGGTVGLSFNFAGFEVEPFAGVRYANLRLRSFNEGTGLGALQLGARTYESVLSNTGARIGGAFQVGGVSVRPEIRGSYRHEFQHDGQRDFSFGFGSTAGQLNFTPVSLGRNYYTGGAGFTVSGANSPLSFVVDYTGEFGKQREVHGITGGLRLTF